MEEHYVWMTTRRIEPARRCLGDLRRVKVPGLDRDKKSECRLQRAGVLLRPGRIRLRGRSGGRRRSSTWCCARD
jgi:hypothetical protein